MHHATKVLTAHYENTLQQYGPTPRGMDWEKNSEKLSLRFEMMLRIIRDPGKRVTLLDVGCGAGLLLDHIHQKNYNWIEYTGVDASVNMIDAAIKKHPDAIFRCLDICEIKSDLPKYDYVVSNGVFTVCDTIPKHKMDDFFITALNFMFKLCKQGISFNVMSKYVDFEVNHLYYRYPGDIIDYCVRNLTRYVTIIHDYNLYEFFTFLYRKGRKQ